MRALFTRLKGASDPFQKVFHMEQGINRIVRRNKTKNIGKIYKEKTNEEIIIVYSYESEWQEAQGANPEVL